MSDEEKQRENTNLQPDGRRDDTLRINRAIRTAIDQLEIAKAKILLPYAGILGDPAWTILLHLFVRQHCGQETSEADMREASGVSDATATRYINYMIDARLLRRECDANGSGHLSLCEVAVVDLVKTLASDRM
ncbi:MAG: hypothetical protein WBO17_06320 [Sphingorhabdus sp.]